MIVATGKNLIRSRIEGNTTPLFGMTLYMGLSTDATAPALADTSVAGEQTANGLARAAVTAAHVNGTNTWTFSNTFIYSGSANVGIQKVMLWDAASGGNLITEDLVSLTTFAAQGDNCPFNVTLSL